MWILESNWLDISLEYLLVSANIGKVMELLCTSFPTSLTWGLAVKMKWAMCEKHLAQGLHWANTPQTVHIVIVSFFRFLFGSAKMPMKLREQNLWSRVSRIPWTMMAFTLSAYYEVPDCSFHHILQNHILKQSRI